MIWANELGLLQFYLIAAFVCSYLIYLLRIVMLSRKKNSVYTGNIFKKIILRSIYFSLILIAMLGPSFGDVKKELKSEGKDIYLLLDVSNSMDAYDLPPSRLEKAKKEMKYLLKNLRYNDRVGLIVYAGEVILQCPLTFDIGAVGLYLESLSTNKITLQGSNLKQALDFADDKFISAANAKDAGTSKVVVLVTDGENFEDGLFETAQKLKDHHISLFIVGIGTEKGSKIPSHPGFKKDHHGKLIVTRLKKETLSRLASIQGETYYEVGNNYSQVNVLADQLNSMQGEVKEVKKIDLSSNKYYYFLAVALFFIIIDGLITVNIIRI